MSGPRAGSLTRHRDIGVTDYQPSNTAQVGAKERAGLSLNRTPRQGWAGLEAPDEAGWSLRAMSALRVLALII